MANSTDLGNGLLLMQFEDAAQPVFLEKKGKDYVFYGEKNDYPEYLLWLYNNSAKHSAIINGKVDYVVGKGLTIEEESSDERAISFLQCINADGETANQVLEKAGLDLEIFNGAYLQVVWNLLGTVSSVYHVDYTKVRSNKDNSVFYVADDWVKYNPDGSYVMNNKPTIKPFPKYQPGSVGVTQILYVKKYHPGIDIYTLPTYRGSATWIEIDIEIGNYHLNNVKGGFFANKLINFNNGVPSPEAQATIEKQFEKKFGGVRGKKWILAFNADASKAASVLDLNVAESDKLFQQLNDTAQQEIFTGHRVTSPMLFGVKTEGQLGGRAELRDASELFQNTYANARQQWLESIFNMLSRAAGSTATFAIQRTEPISFEFAEATIAQNMSQDEIREKMGLPPIVKKDNDESAQATINAINSLSPLVANKVLENLSSDELRALIGLAPAVPGSVAPPASPAQFSMDQDDRAMQEFSQHGHAKNGFTIVKKKKVLFRDDFAEHVHFITEQENLTKIEQSVLDLLSKDPLTTQQVMAEALNVDVQIVNNAVRALESLGLIEVTEAEKNGATEVTRKPVPDAKKLLKNSEPVTKSIQVMYSYEGPQDDKNRAFCAKMLELDRLYSRKDIETISTALGYSVWTRRGGWYTVPGTDIHRPYCRHSWVSNIVVKNAENTATNE